MQFYIYENAMWPQIAQKQQHKKSAAFPAICSGFFCYFCLELRNQQNSTFFGQAKEEPSFLEIKIVWDYLHMSNVYLALCHHSSV